MDGLDNEVDVSGADLGLTAAAAAAAVAATDSSQISTVGIDYTPDRSM